MQSFDATNIPPQQGGGQAHPFGMFDFQITNTFGQQSKNNSDAYMFVVEMTSPAGKVENRYNMWNPSGQAVEIATKELSALCHAIGMFKMNFPTNQDGSPNLPLFGAEIRGGRGRMEVGPQMRKNDQGQMIDTGYVEVKRVFDAQGNEPGKAKVQQAQQPQQPVPQQGQPMTAQPGGGWGNPSPQPAPAPASPTPTWGNGAAAAPAAAAPAATWSNPAPTGGQAPNAPPWALGGQR